MSLDFGSNENAQHNGGISHATTPKPSGKHNRKGEAKKNTVIYLRVAFGNVLKKDNFIRVLNVSLL